jgi:hypothetical protein
MTGSTNLKRGGQGILPACVDFRALRLSLSGLTFRVASSPSRDLDQIVLITIVLKVGPSFQVTKREFGIAVAGVGCDFQPCTVVNPALHRN